MSTPRKKAIRFQGQVITVYSIGYLAHNAKRSTDTVRRWERKGILPDPLFKIPNSNLRWYTATEIYGYTRIFLNANVRTKIPIGQTTFKLQAIQFRLELKKRLDSGELKLPASLVHEKEADQDIKTKIKNRWKKEADSIITDL